PEYANTLVYQLKHADAVELADRLNTLFAPPGVARPDREGDEDAQQAYYSWLLSMRGQRGQEEERPISNLIGKVRVVPDSRINALLITTSVQHFNVLRQLIEQLDVESPKVLLRVRLVELTRTDETRVGTRWTSDSTIFETDDFNNGLLSNFGVAWEEITTDTVLTADFDVSALVQFLERQFDAHIVSEPSLSVNNNREATVFVGAEVPFITETQREPGTTARNDAFEYREVGTKLVITPHINKEDNVVTEIQVESSQIRPGEVLFGGFILDTRTFESELAVEDGQTIVIGGIFRQNESETVNRVPILGHIPLVGLLFSKKDTILTTTELIAFITPHVMRTAAAANEVTRREAERVERLSDWLPAGMSQPEQDQ
ncbi:MAG: secretin N-terminal domain-containing protein, partial [Candidatus Brocadiia bacterium]